MIVPGEAEAGSAGRQPPNKRFKLTGAHKWAELRCLAGGHDRGLNLLAPARVAPAA